MRKQNRTFPKHGFGGRYGGAVMFPTSSRTSATIMKRPRSSRSCIPIIIKTDILKNDPWVATSLFEAFTASRRAYDEFMQQPHRLSFAWGRSYLEEERKFFGKHPFYQGLKENQHDVQNMITFADQQGMLARPLTVEELLRRTLEIRKSRPKN